MVASWCPTSFFLAKISMINTTSEKQRKIPPIPIRVATNPERINSSV
jgi:hypothetical protein